MRKSLWLIPVVLLFTALGSTTARADTIVTSGGLVTGINGITIAGTTYNVTWGYFEDPTFAASPLTAEEMNLAIAQDLASIPYVSVPPTTNLPQCLGVDGGANTYSVSLTFNFCPDLNLGVSFPLDTATWASLVVEAPGVFAWDEFAVVPEPGTAPLTLAGLGVIAVLMWKRRQDALSQAKAT